MHSCKGLVTFSFWRITLFVHPYSWRKCYSYAFRATNCLYYLRVSTFFRNNSHCCRKSWAMYNIFKWIAFVWKLIITKILIFKKGHDVSNFISILLKLYLQEKLEQLCVLFKTFLKMFFTFVCIPLNIDNIWKSAIFSNNLTEFMGYKLE